MLSLYCTVLYCIPCLLKSTQASLQVSWKAYETYSRTVKKRRLWTWLLARSTVITSTRHCLWRRHCLGPRAKFESFGCRWDLSWKLTLRTKNDRLMFRLGLLCSGACCRGSNTQTNKEQFSNATFRPYTFPTWYVYLISILSVTLKLSDVVSCI